MEQLYETVTEILNTLLLSNLAIVITHFPMWLINSRNQKNMGNNYYFNFLKTIAHPIFRVDPNFRATTQITTLGVRPY